MQLHRDDALRLINRLRLPGCQQFSEPSNPAPASDIHAQPKT
jgi:hypothetical protein